MLPVIVAETLPRRHLRFRITLALRRRLSGATLLPGVFTEALPAFALSFAIGVAPRRLAAVALLPNDVAGLSLRLYRRLVIRLRHRRHVAVTSVLPVIVAEAPPVLILSSGMASASKRRVAIPRGRPNFVARPRRRAIIRLAVEIFRPPRLVLGFIDRLDNVVEPLTDRQAGRAGGLARGSARFQTETSEIPRTARFHSHVPHEEQDVPLFRAVAREQTTQRAWNSVLQANVQDYGKEHVKNYAPPVGPGRPIPASDLFSRPRQRYGYRPRIRPYGASAPFERRPGDGVLSLTQIGYVIPSGPAGGAAAPTIALQGGRHADLQGTRWRRDVPFERCVSHRSLQQPSRICRRHARSCRGSTRGSSEVQRGRTDAAQSRRRQGRL